jgi:hypothetical protein
VADGWVCTMEDFPAIKFFSATDQSATFPTPISCVRVSKPVHGFSYRVWADWYKLLRFIEDLP